MKNIGILLVILSYGFMNNIFCQTSLIAGDIAIVGLNCDEPDDFAFVLLKDISTNTIIHFTDNGWLTAGGFRSGEGVLTYTAPSHKTEGTVIIYSANVTDFTPSGSFALAVAGDQIIAYQGTLIAPTLLYALNDEGAGIWQADATNSNTSALPSGLINGTTAVALNEIDNAYYDGGVNSDLNLLRTQIGNNLNWTGDDTTPFNFVLIIPNPLPVELSSFTAIVLENSVKLNWRTETEVNNYGFEILRGVYPAKSRTQNDKWEKIGFVEGNGNSNSPKDYTFTDNLTLTRTLYYRLKQIDTDGQSEYSKVIEVDAGIIPAEIVLEQNYPNPFNPSTTIRFNFTHSGDVRLSIYNLLGEQIMQLVNGFLEAGIHTVNFNASDLNSGVYLYKFETNGIIQSRKMILAK